MCLPEVSNEFAPALTNIFYLLKKGKELAVPSEGPWGTHSLYSFYLFKKKTKKAILFLKQHSPETPIQPNSANY